MNWFILLTILAASMFEFLAKLHVLPKMMVYSQEVMGALALLYVVAEGVRHRFRYLRPAYWFLFAAILFVLLSGIVMNGVDAGPLFAGIRNYLRAIPLFFLPIVWLVNEKTLRKQVMFLFGIALLQFPIVALQRLRVVAAARTSGDSVVGTMTESGILTTFLVCCACVLIGMYLRKRISFWKFIPLLLILLVPTAVNETKATILLVPIGLMSTFILGSPRGVRARNAVIGFGMLCVFAAIFVPVYDYFMKPRWGYGIIDFLTMEGRVEGYVDKDATFGSQHVGLVDGIVFPLRELSKDFPTLAFGLGIGNASDSALGPQFTGPYFEKFGPFLQSTAAMLIIETGLLGLGLVYTLYFLIFRDAWVVASRDRGLYSAFAVGWMGVVTVIAAASFYRLLIPSGISFLFWYLSGVIAAHRMRMALAPRPEPAKEPLLSSGVAMPAPNLRRQARIGSS